MNHDARAGQTPSPAGRKAVRRRLGIALLLALSILTIEIVGAIVSNSLALFADAGHVAGDASAILLALGAIWLAGRPGGRQRTFGWYRAEIIAATLNGGALLVIAGVIIWQAASRVGDDPQIAGTALLGFAAGGLLVNLVSAFILRESQRENLNVRGVYYHVIGDALGSVAALIAGIVIIVSGWQTIDLVVSVIIALLIVAGAVALLREAANVLLEAAPPGLDVDAVAGEICSVDGVIGVHDLHLWTVTSGFPALSCHIEIGDAADGESVLVAVTQRLQTRFALSHVTLQPESAALHNAMSCCDFPDQPTASTFSAGHRETILPRS